MFGRFNTNLALNYVKIITNKDFKISRNRCVGFSYHQNFVELRLTLWLGNAKLFMTNHVGGSN